MSSNTNYLLKQQISNLKKQASKRYNSSVRNAHSTGMNSGMISSSQMLQSAIGNQQLE